MLKLSVGWGIGHTHTVTQQFSHGHYFTLCSFPIRLYIMGVVGFQRILRKTAFFETMGIGGLQIMNDTLKLPSNW